MYYNIEEIISYFKNIGICFFPVSIEIQNNLGNTQSREFINKFGLPNLNNIFIIEDLNFYSERSMKVIYNKYLTIGNDFVGEICIDLLTGELLSIEANSDNKCYMNKNLSDFFYCLYIYQKYFIEVSNCINEEQEKNIYLYIKKQFNDLDIKILCDNSNWWSEIIEPLEYGLI